MWLALRVTISQCWLVSLNKSEQPKNGSGSSPGRVFAPYWSENGYTLCPFWSGIGYDFWGNYGIVWTYLSFQLYSKWVEKKEKFSIQIRNGIEEFFCLRANLSNDNIISPWKASSENGYGFSRSCLKTGVENYIFWSEIRVRIWRTGRHTLTKNSQEYSLRGCWQVCFWFNRKFSLSSI